MVYCTGTGATAGAHPRTMTTQILIQTYGYPALAVGVIFEPEIAAMLGGFAAYQGYLPFIGIWVVTCLSSILADQFLFFLGRYQGRWLLKKFPSMQPRMDRLHGFLERNQRWIGFMLRFAYGFRTLIPIALGTSHVDAKRFVFLNVLSAIAWTTIFTSIGFLLGGTIEHALGKFEHAERVLITTFIIILTTSTMLHLFGDRIKELLLRKRK